MKISLSLPLLLLLILSLFSTVSYAEDSNDYSLQKIDPHLISYKLIDNHDDSWINVNTNVEKSPLSFSASKTNGLNEEIALAWNFSNFLSINLNVFESNYNSGFEPQIVSNNTSNFNKFIPVQAPTYDINRRLSGYKLGLSSELGLGEQYKLGINLDYGLLDGADLAGFSNNAINTTSFEVGIRKNKFGASINSDFFLEADSNVLDNSRFGLELDWYFSDDTTFSLGSKQRMSEQTSQANNLESITGSVQYIKFQHNL